MELIKQCYEQFKGRFLPTIRDHNILDGLRFAPEKLPRFMDAGAVGYKIWAGRRNRTGGAVPWYAIDDPANDATFTKMEQTGLVGASIHISVPSYPGYDGFDPVEYWRSQKAWQKVLNRHPKLVVNAHMLFLCSSDEQLDYLRYMLETYPGLNVDTAAAFPFLRRINRNYLREFMIKYSDRILFGTDVATRKITGTKGVERYRNYFRYLESDELVSGYLVGNKPEARGLALPIDVLEKIYYKNAMRIYPRVKHALKNLGYDVE